MDKYFSQFLTDVLTAAGLLSCGKRDRGLAQRLREGVVELRELSGSPESISEVLDLHAPTVSLTGTREEKAEQLLNMFELFTLNKEEDK